MIACIRALVECESPSDQPASVNRFTAAFARIINDIARVRTFPGRGYGDHLRCEFTLPGPPKNGQVLALGHSDTVWPLGTLTTMPFRQSRGRLWGPGVLDMKSGLVLFVFAMRILRELAVPVRRKIVLQVNSDEEMVSYVERTRGAIGYVGGSANTDGVKVLAVDPESSRGERILLKRVEPEYPKELQHRGIEGTVRLSLTVSARGSVHSVQVVGGNPILAEAAQKAVREWVYSPSATSSTIEDPRATAPMVAAHVFPRKKSLLFRAAPAGMPDSVTRCTSSARR